MSTSMAPLAALTTVFTAPCATSWLLATTTVPSQYPPFPTGQSSCNPPSGDKNIAGKGFDYYSPGICPSGFSVGPGCSIAATRTAERFPVVQSGETAVYCVPSGHTCTTDTTDFRGGVWGFSSAMPTSGIVTVTVASAMQIRFLEQDLSTLQTHPLTPGQIFESVTNSVAQPQSATADDATTTITTTVTQTHSSIRQMSTAQSHTTPTLTLAVPTTIVSVPLPSIDTPTTKSSNDPTLLPTPALAVKPNDLQDNETEMPSGAINGSVAINSPSVSPGGLAAIVLSGSGFLVGLLVTIYMLLQQCNKRQWARERQTRGDGNEPPREMVDIEMNSKVTPSAAPYKPVGNSMKISDRPGSLAALVAPGSRNSNAPRWSWRSRVSRRLTVRTFRGAPLSPLSESGAGTARSPDSMRESFYERDSGDWEIYAAKAGWTNGLTAPAPTYQQRPLPALPPKTPKTPSFKYLCVDADIARKFRASDGTFGLPGKSPTSLRSWIP